MAAPIRESEPQAQIEPVRDEPTLAAALAAVDELEPDPAEAPLLASLGLDGALRHFAAWRDGAPAGLVSTFVSESTLTLTTLAVAPGRRRRGIGRALVLHALSAAAGCEVALLAPTPGTIPFYAALGFELYRFPPDRAYYTPFG
jgi:GNAT superfamily N-acetyltransferase